MTQYDFGALSPADSGSTLAAKLSGVIPALLTNHKGPTRPSYTQPGMLWINDAGATWLLALYDGEQDITIAGINPTTHALTTAGVPTSRKVKTGAAFLLNGVAGTDAAPAEADLTADLLIELIFASLADTIAGLRDDVAVHPAGLKAAIAALASSSGHIYTDIDVINVSGNYVVPADLDASITPFVMVFGAGAGNTVAGDAGKPGGLAMGEVSLTPGEKVPVTIGASALSGTSGSSSFKTLSATGGSQATNGVGSGGIVNAAASSVANTWTSSNGAFNASVIYRVFFGTLLKVKQTTLFAKWSDLLFYSSYVGGLTTPTAWSLPANGAIVPGAGTNGAVANSYGFNGAVLVFYRRKGA